MGTADLGSLHRSISDECNDVSEESCRLVGREVSQVAPRKAILMGHVCNRKRWGVEERVIFGEFDLGKHQTFEVSVELIDR
jgi:hypothetical protein